MSRHAEKQQRYRQRLKAQGLVHVQGWVTPEQAAMIRRIMAERAGESSIEAQQGQQREESWTYSNQNLA